MRSAIVLRVWHFLLLLLPAAAVHCCFLSGDGCSCCCRCRCCCWLPFGSARFVTCRWTQIVCLVFCIVCCYFYIPYIHISYVYHTLAMYTLVCIPIRILLFSFVLWFCSLRVFFFIQMFSCSLYCLAFYFMRVCAPCVRRVCAVCVLCLFHGLTHKKAITIYWTIENLETLFDAKPSRIWFNISSFSQNTRNAWALHFRRIFSMIAAVSYTFMNAFYFVEGWEWVGTF